MIELYIFFFVLCIIVWRQRQQTAFLGEYSKSAIKMCVCLLKKTRNKLCSFYEFETVLCIWIESFEVHIFSTFICSVNTLVNVHYGETNDFNDWIADKKMLLGSFAFFVVVVVFCWMSVINNTNEMAIFDHKIEWAANFIQLFTIYSVYCTCDLPAILSIPYLLFN